MLREAETGGGTYTGVLVGLTVLIGCFKIVAYERNLRKI